MESIYEFIDFTLNNGMGKMFDAQMLTDGSAIVDLQKVCMRLNGVIVDMRLNQLGGRFANKSCLLYNALVYKFGRSNRHQKFWKSALQVYAELKRINKRNVLDEFSKFVKVLEQTNFTYRPSSTAVCYLGCAILERILRLDRLRIYCFHAANGSMGFIELGHHITFNLISIAIASEVAQEALTHIRHLCTIYENLAEWFSLYSKNFPQSLSFLNLRSTNVKIPQSSHARPNLNNVEAILRLLEAEESKADDDGDKSDAGSSDSEVEDDLLRKPYLNKSWRDSNTQRTPRDSSSDKRPKFAQKSNKVVYSKEFRRNAE